MIDGVDIIALFKSRPLLPHLGAKASPPRDLLTRWLFLFLHLFICFLLFFSSSVYLPTTALNVGPRREVVRYRVFTKLYWLSLALQTTMAN